MIHKNDNTALEYGREFIAFYYKINKLLASLTSRSELYHGEFMMLAVIDRKMEENNRKGAKKIGVRVGDIVKSLHGTKSATSKMLRTLEEKEYIERTTSPNDRRSVYIQLTDKGEKLITKNKHMMEQFTMEVVEELGIQKWNELIDLLNNLYSIMNNKINRNSNEKGDCIC